MWMQWSFTVETVQAFHDDQGGALRGTNTIHILAAEGLRVVHLGDLGHELSEEQLAPLRSCDALLIPVGGFYTIDAKTARELADAIDAQLVIPMHYRGEDFGFDEIDTVEPFVKLSKNVEFAEGNSIELPDFGEPRTVVLKLR